MAAPSKLEYMEAMVMQRTDGRYRAVICQCFDDPDCDQYTMATPCYVYAHDAKRSAVELAQRASIDIDWVTEEV